MEHVYDVRNILRAWCVHDVHLQTANLELPTPLSKFGHKGYQDYEGRSSREPGAITAPL